eukprot:CAMPEP_0201680458 /NCGR_PEP_ID=MMETSP0494-20130426/50611_1 /ASSEMBLY_ACC=CAM_ASM_000839 /TAXON_ID=420259 /ORGANISM="Thalassiosira gravida, Strain GMp14c1" /LENGTH=571 /DNA_ID=CAMNT_0048164181 /DNA_START=99 /DNA_END=1813 /DNA_ORIENTATION=-
MQTAEHTPNLFIEDQVSLQGEHDQITKNSLSCVCEWMPTSLRLPSQNAAQKGDKNNNLYLCLPVQLSKPSCSFKKNEEEEECKDDAASRLRLSELDHYLAAVAPLASSTQALLFASISLGNENTHQLRRKAIKHLGRRGRRSKYERQSRLLAKRPRSSHHRLVTSTNCGRVINVLQGEIAHCTPSQADVLVSDDATTCHIVALIVAESSMFSKGRLLIAPPSQADVLVSDDATTCHIVALRSCRSGSEEGEKTIGSASSSIVLATMTHIDGPGYEYSIRDAVNEHIKHHSIRRKKNYDTEDCKESCAEQNNVGSSTIEMSIYIMGGFNDTEGSSIEITDSVLQTFAALSNEYDAYSVSRRVPRICMTLETCAVASANDNGTGCPLGRGLAMEVATGNIFLAVIDGSIIHGSTLSSTHPTASCNGTGKIAFNNGTPLFNPSPYSSYISAQGPDVVLRTVRIWASAFHPHDGEQGSRLNIIHRPDRDYLTVEPFFFGPHMEARDLLKCTDEYLLQILSTSPEVEKTNFVIKARESLNFMNGTTSMIVFACGQPVKFRRVGQNEWVRISLENIL